MSLFRRAAGSYLLGRALRGQQQRGRRSGYSAPAMGRRRPPRRREGFGFFGPVPTYSRRTRRGTQVSVGGCCLPIPLVLALSTAAGARALLRR